MSERANLLAVANERIAELEEQLADAEKINRRWQTTVSDMKISKWEWDQKSLKSTLMELTRIFKLETGSRLSDLLDAAEQMAAQSEEDQ